MFCQVWCTQTHTMCSTNSTLNLPRVLPATRSRLFPGSCLKRLLMLCVDESQGWELHSVLSYTEAVSCLQQKSLILLTFLQKDLLQGQLLRLEYKKCIMQTSATQSKRPIESVMFLLALTSLLCSLTC